VPTPREVHRGATRVLSTLMVVIGAVLLVVTLAGGGGPLAIGVLLGVLFIAAGTARLYLNREGR
jgi:hypothetical protein